MNACVHALLYVCCICGNVCGVCAINVMAIFSVHSIKNEWRGVQAGIWLVGIVAGEAKPCHLQ